MRFKKKEKEGPELRLIFGHKKERKKIKGKREYRLRYVLFKCVLSLSSFVAPEWGLLGPRCVYVRLVPPIPYCPSTAILSVLVCFAGVSPSPVNNLGISLTIYFFFTRHFVLIAVNQSHFQEPSLCGAVAIFFQKSDIGLKSGDTN